MNVQERGQRNLQATIGAYVIQIAMLQAQVEELQAQLPQPPEVEIMKKPRLHNGGDEAPI